MIYKRAMINIYENVKTHANIVGRNYRIKGGITCLGIKLHQKRIDKFVLEI